MPVMSNMTLYYETLDASGAAPVDYQSTYGPQRVTLAVTYDSATGTYTADGTIQVQTNSVLSYGGNGSVAVQLVNPFLCQFATGDGDKATATIHEPQLAVS